MNKFQTENLCKSTVFGLNYIKALTNAALDSMLNL